MKQIYKLCSNSRIFAFYHKKSKAYVKNIPAHTDLVRRQFSANEPNKIWLTDATKHNTNKERSIF